MGEEYSKKSTERRATVACRKKSGSAVRRLFPTELGKVEVSIGLLALRVKWIRHVNLS
jgi:hypothetical protein